MVNTGDQSSFGLLESYDSNAAQRSRSAIFDQNLSEQERLLLSRIETRANNELLFGLKYHVMRRAFLDLAYYNGFQHIYWDYRRHRIGQIPVNRNLTRVTDNKIMPAVQRAVKILTGKIDFTVRPKNSDYKSKAEARAGDRAIRHLYRTKRWARKIRKMARWAAITGCGFLRPYWNPNAGPEEEFFIDPQSGETIPPESISEQTKESLRKAGLSKKVRRGEVDISVHSPFEVYVPDTAEDTDDLQWYLIAQRRSLNWIRQRWPKMGVYVPAETFSAWERNSFEARILSMAGGAAEAGYEGFAGVMAYDDDKSAILKTYVEPPSTEHPRGVYAVVAGGILLESGDSPSYTFGLNGCDLVKFDFIERPGSFWPMSLVENMISPQRLLNSNEGQLTDIRKSVLKPKLLSPRGSAIAKTAFTNVSADVYEYDPEKGVPTWQPFPNIPNGLFGTHELHLQSLRDLSAQHEAMQGQNPSGVRAGYSIGLLRERDLDFYQPIIESHAESYQVLWSHVHQLIKRTWTSPMMVQELARTELVWSGWISGEDLAEDAKVVVDAAEMMPKSTAAKQAFAGEFLQYGPNLMTFPPMLRAAILETMEIGDDSKVKEIFELDVRWAEYALETMIGDPERGIPGYDVPVRPGIDDHQTILQVVRQFQKTAYYMSLPPETILRIQRYAQGQNEALIAAVALENAFTNQAGGGQKGDDEGKEKEQARQEAVTQ